MSGRKRFKTVQEQFENQIFYSIDGCWYWIGTIGPRGYGSINVNGASKRAHRVSYEIYKGNIPAGLFVCHSCDNPLCVRPDHLILGTQKENMQDMWGKGRGCKGEKAPWAKLKRKDVDEIRELYAKGGVAMRPLAKRFNVSYTTVNFVINNKSWK